MYCDFGQLATREPTYLIRNSNKSSPLYLPIVFSLCGVKRLHCHGYAVSGPKRTAHLKRFVGFWLSVARAGETDLRKSDNFDFAAYYRQNLTHSGSLELAIAGLGETGDANDERLIIPFLSDERAKIRAAAVRSTGLLSKGRPSAALFDSIQDASKKVASEACNALERSIDAIELPDLANLFRKEGRTSVRMAILNLIDLKDTWATMPDLVEAAASDDSEVAKAAQRKILGKFNRVFTTPPDDQRDAILSALRRNAGSVPAKFATEFSTWLASRA